MLVRCADGLALLRWRGTVSPAAWPPEDPDHAHVYVAVNPERGHALVDLAGVGRHMVVQRWAREGLSQGGSTRDLLHSDGYGIGGAMSPSEWGRLIAVAQPAVEAAQGILSLEEASGWAKGLSWKPKSRRLVGRECPVNDYWCWMIFRCCVHRLLFTTTIVDS